MPPTVNNTEGAKGTLAVPEVDQRVVSPVGMSPAPPPSIEIVFTKDPPQDLQCFVCSQVLRSPMKMSCGDRICASCLLELKSSECPKCNQPLDMKNAKKDKEAQKCIQQLGVRCSFNDNGCTWEGALKDLQNHVYNCKLADIICPRGCGMSYTKGNEAKHLSEECGKRTTMCEFCEKEIPIKGMDVHLKVCPAVKMDCPNKCGLLALPRDQLRQHLPVCPNAGSSCPFGEFGCVYAGGREMLQEHIREEPIRHLTLLCDGVLDLKILLSVMQVNMEAMIRNMDVLQKKCETLEKLYGAQLIWRIDNVKQKQNEARSGSRATIFSPPFMTGRHGYKMVLSVSLYGDGPVRGQYMSVFVAIMRGEYDALLEWPFTHKVTLTLLDQNPWVAERNNIMYAIEPNPIAAHKPFLDRPISERNASFGAVKFCELDIAEKYICDDVLFIKVNVDTHTASVL